MGVGRAIQAHNITPGLIDVRSTSDSLDILKGATAVLKDWFRILGALQVNPARALEELNSDWTASQEVADVLMLRHDVPFRVGHHFVSEIVTYARAHVIRPSEFPYEEAQRIWYVAHEHLELETTAPLPMSHEEFKQSLDPAEIVRNRATTGGPQPIEMERMLKDARKHLKGFKEWIANRTESIQAALASLDQDFESLLAK